MVTLMVVTNQNLKPFHLMKTMMINRPILVEFLSVRLCTTAQNYSVFTSATTATKYITTRRYIRLRWWYFKSKWFSHPSNWQYFSSRLFQHNGTVVLLCFYTFQTFISSLNSVIAGSLASLLGAILKLIQMAVFMKKLRREKSQIWLMILKRNFIQKQHQIKITWHWF